MNTTLVNPLITNPRGRPAKYTITSTDTSPLAQRLIRERLHRKQWYDKNREKILAESRERYRVNKLKKN